MEQGYFALQPKISHYSATNIFFNQSKQKNTFKMKVPLDCSVIEPIPLDAKNIIITQDLQRVEGESLSAMLEILENLLEGDNYISFLSPNPIFKVRSSQSLSEAGDAVVSGWGEDREIVRNLESMHFEDTFGSPRKKLKTCESIDTDNIMSQDPPKLEGRGFSNMPAMMENVRESDFCLPLPSSTPFPNPSGPLVEGLQSFSNIPVIMESKFESDNCPPLRSPRPNACGPLVKGLQRFSNTPCMMENMSESKNCPPFSSQIPSLCATLVKDLQCEGEEVDFTGNEWHDNKDLMEDLQSTRRTRIIDEVSSYKGAKSSPSVISEADTQELQTQKCFSNYRSVEDSTKNLPQYNESFITENCSRHFFDHSEKWNQNFQELLNFHQVNGHCLVPHKWMENVGLAHWVKRQRYQYKLKKDGLRTTLTDSREEALGKLGFVWEPQTARWEETLNEVRDYKKIHGTCNVPGKSTAFPRLALWVQSQRRQYRNFIRGKQSTLTPERIEKLNALGFVWNPRKLKLKN